MTTTTTIPKTIWTYWDDPENVPSIVRHCIATWHIHNPDWKIFLLNKNNWRRHLGPADLDEAALRFNESPNRFSDYLRVALLVKYGGIWMDASILAFESLERMFAMHRPPYPPWDTAPAEAGFVAFARVSISADLEYPICDSWFLASEKGGALLQATKVEMMRMQSFDTIAAYIDDLEAKGTKIWNLSSAEYAVVYGWINHALRQGGKTNPFRACLYEGVSAGVGPYWYMNDAWDEKMPLERLCTDASFRTALVKLGGPQRRLIDEHPELSCMFRMQHGPAGMQLLLDAEDDKLKCDKGSGEFAW